MPVNGKFQPPQIYSNYDGFVRKYGRVCHVRPKRNICQDLGLILWKNYIIRKRHWMVTLLELLLPMLLAGGLAALRTRTVSINEGFNKVLGVNATIHLPTDQVDIIESAFMTLTKKKTTIMAYIPANKLTDKIMQEKPSVILNSEIHLVYVLHPQVLRPFDNETELEKFVNKRQLLVRKSREELTAAIIFGPPFSTFSENLVTDNISNTEFDYTIRLTQYTIDTSRVFPRFQLAGPNHENQELYQNTGFTGLQIILDKILIKTLTNQSVNQEITQQTFPYPPYKSTKGLENEFLRYGAMFLVIGFIFIVPSIVVKVVSERETGIKVGVELMKITGLPSYYHWLGWTIDSLVVLTFSISGIIFFLFFTFNTKNGPVILYGDPSLWWVVFFLYAIAATGFCFLVSVLVNHAMGAVALGMVLWLVLYFGISIPMDNNNEQSSVAWKMLSSLFPNVALHLAINSMYALEVKGVGAKWSNVLKPVSPTDGTSLAHLVLMLVIDIVLYVTLTLYLENVLPSKFGVRRSWYYIFQPNVLVSFVIYAFIQKSTWKSSVCFNERSMSKPVEGDATTGFEQELSELPIGVSIKNLSKAYNNKNVVDDLSVNFFECQITALVGHNGAGKTTTLSILTGLTAPHKGTALVNGKDIRSQMDLIRESLGVCPQHNMLFDKLTVWEHLVLFARFKGRDPNRAKKEADIFVVNFELVDKRNSLSSELSGGQKRKLSLAMALIGGSKVVILDECTSGMDLEARRLVWDILLEMRKERTIIVSTHFMEEADILGDKIVVMSRGKIKCCGSAAFLKKTYGDGYTLKLSVLGGNKKMIYILNLIQSIASKASLKSSSPGVSSDGRDVLELFITVPDQDGLLSKFPNLFAKLQEAKESLEIVSIGLVGPSMDQVFIKIANEQDNPSGNLAIVPLGMIGGKDNHSERNISNLRPKFHLQCIGLLRKKFFYTKRNTGLLFFQFILPMIMLILAIFQSTLVTSPPIPLPKIELSLKQFREPITIYQADNNEVLGNAYSSVLKGYNQQSLDESQEETSLISTLLEVAKNDLFSFRDRYVVGAYLNSTLVTAMYSTFPIHSAPISLNLVSNALLKSLSPEANNSIRVSYHPLGNTLFSTLESAMLNLTHSLIVPIIFGSLVPIGLALFSASFVKFPTEERVSKAKQLQVMTGVSIWSYWGMSFLWDFLLISMLVFMMGACFWGLETKGAFTSYGGCGAVLLIFLIYGYSTLSLSYLVSLLAPSPSVGFATLTILHIMAGMILPLGTFIADSLHLTSDSPVFTSFRYIFRLISSYGGGMSIMRYAAISTANSRCNVLTLEDKDIICNKTYSIASLIRQCCDNCDEFENTDDTPRCFQPERFLGWDYVKLSNTDYGKFYTTPGIGQELTWMMISACIYQVLVVFLDSAIHVRLRGGVCRAFRCFQRNFKKPVPDTSAFDVDEDVLMEQKRVEKLCMDFMEQQGDSLVVSKLSKSYGRLEAVKNLSFGLKPGEVFGILGVNGAGKTTAFKILTGDLRMSSGNAFSFSKSLIKNRRKFLRNVGYCPQFDATIGSISGREMLEVMALLRGISISNVEGEVEKWLGKLGLESSGDLVSSQYSGGMKRRLSIGLAMIGNPPVVLLDEPSSGVDPVARRQFWDLISSAKASGQSIILTSHSMEEIEILCSKLAIMSGQLQCLGSVDHLRNKFAQGFTLSVRIRSSCREELERWKQPNEKIDLFKKEILQRFQPSEIMDEHQNSIQFQLKDQSLHWGTVYGVVEEILNSQIVPSCSETFSEVIEEYKVTPTCLEEVFLTISMKKRHDLWNCEMKHKT